jgi:hypothetical protein
VSTHSSLTNGGASGTLGLEEFAVTLEQLPLHLSDGPHPPRGHLEPVTSPSRCPQGGLSDQLSFLAVLGFELRLARQVFYT